MGAYTDNATGPSAVIESGQVHHKFMDSCGSPAKHIESPGMTRQESVDVAVAAFSGSPQDMYNACPSHVQTWFNGRPPYKLHEHWQGAQSQVQQALEIAAALGWTPPTP